MSTYDLGYSFNQITNAMKTYTKDIAEIYDSTKTYYEDDFVIYGGLLYQCIALTATGTWDSTKWQAQKIFENSGYVVIKSGGSEWCMIPTQKGHLYYSGSTLTPEFNGYWGASDEKMAAGGTTSAVEPGTYTATFTLKHPDETKWEDATTEVKSVSWSVEQAIVQIPTYTSLSFTYTGSEISPFTYDSSRMTATNITATNAGTYNATFTLNSTTKMKWADNTTEPKVFTWTINKATVELPVGIETAFIYDGTTKTPEFEYDANLVTFGGDTSAINVGAYTATFSLKSAVNTEWVNHTTADIDRDWEIVATIKLDAFTLSGDPDSLTITSR